MQILQGGDPFHIEKGDYPGTPQRACLVAKIPVERLAGFQHDQGIGQQITHFLRLAGFGGICIGCYQSRHFQGRRGIYLEGYPPIVIQLIGGHACAADFCRDHPLHGNDFPPENGAAVQPPLAEGRAREQEHHRKAKDCLFHRWNISDN